MLAAGVPRAQTFEHGHVEKLARRICLLDETRADFWHSLFYFSDFARYDHDQMNWIASYQRLPQKNLKK